MSLGKVTKTPMMDIRVRCIGVMKRDRKVKLHNISIKEGLAYQDIDLAEYVEQAKIFVKSRMKTLEKCELYLSPWTCIEEEGYAHSLKQVTFGDTRYRKLDIGSDWL